MVLAEESFGAVDCSPSAHGGGGSPILRQREANLGTPSFADGAKSRRPCGNLCSTRLQGMEDACRAGLTRPEEFGPLAPNNLTHQFSAISNAANDLFDRQSVLGQSDNRGVRLLASQIAFVLQLFRARKKIGSIIVAPIAPQIVRMDLRTALRKAVLAFSMRCQRSAT